LHVVVLHKLEDAVAILEKRSAIYSNRREFPINDLLGIAFTTPLLGYGERWRTHRRIFHDNFKKEKMLHYQGVVSEKVHLLLGEFLHDPAGVENHCKWIAGSVILAVSFGYNIRPTERNNHLVEAAEFIDQLFLQLAVPGRTLIDVLPFLKYIPPWVPGAYTQRECAKSRRLVAEYKAELFAHTENNMASGKVEECILADLLQSRTEQDVGYDKDTLKDVMGTMYLAGVETVSSSAVTLVFSLVVHTEAQKKAQAEIDRVVGTGRLPTFDDRDSLPYVDALLREILRWRPIMPLALPHTSIEDDVYKGFFIPKGTMVMPNFWAITRDESIYHEPERFNPERFFDADGSLNGDTVVEYAFGFGRRACPGKHMADSILWLTLACLLSVFNLSKAKDDNGREIEIDDEAFLDSFVTHPLPFKYSITPRSKQAEALIRAGAMDANEENLLVD
jgi:cytochrome P450